MPDAASLVGTRPARTPRAGRVLLSGGLVLVVVAATAAAADHLGHGSHKTTAVAPGRDGPPAATRRRLDLNKATFDELRSLDLSSTQSRRLLAYRKRLHGFESIDQLDQVPGFPKRVRDQLQHQLTV